MCSIVDHRRDAEMAQLTTTQRDREFYHYRRVNHALCLQSISNLDRKSRALAWTGVCSCQQWQVSHGSRHF
jgi:hypothetical protein